MNKLPIVRDTDTDHAAQRISTATIQPDQNGCPYCDDFPDWPARHCGKPGCRDAQALAWARQTNRDPGEVLASIDAAVVDAGGLCGTCARQAACTVGEAVVATQDTLGASVDACRGYSRAR